MIVLRLQPNILKWRIALLEQHNTWLRFVVAAGKPRHARKEGRRTSLIMFSMAMDLSDYAIRRIQDEKVAWLTTVKPDGSPLPTPVWFVWSDDAFIILTDPNALKAKNIRQNARVALNFNGDPHGGNIVVFSGAAFLDATGLSEDEKRSYLKKYEKEIPEIGYSVETFEKKYAAVIRFRPERVRADE